MYTSQKLFDGFSATFRQWRANHSHCRFLHGYALSFLIIWECDSLDEKNWVVDFGGQYVKALKVELSKVFDHTTIIALDDPHFWKFENLGKEGIIQMVQMKDVGCEKFARFVFELASHTNQDKRVRVQSVTCYENGRNAASYSHG